MGSDRDAILPLMRKDAVESLCGEDEESAENDLRIFTTKANELVDRYYKNRRAEEPICVHPILMAFDALEEIMEA